MLDIIGSMVIRGAIVLMTLYLSVSLQSAYTYKNTLYTVKQKTVIPAEVLTDDIRLAGYGPTTSKVFTTAASQEMQFSADINNDSVAENVHYYLGPTYTGSSHRSLYRVVSSINGGAPYELARDVDSLCFTYYDVYGNSLSGTNVSGIKSIKVSLVMESNAQVADEITTAPSGSGLYSKQVSTDTVTANFGTKYVRAFWERTVFPQNL
ncbi:MAG TPA: hypothetical protein VMF88_03215 [Bacteroidota bacterium]|nr:hypothetical protein [Bacteroidota bacterium]